MESICPPHGCMAVPPKGTGAAPDEVLYDLLEVMIIGLEMPAQRRMFSSPNMLIVSILGPAKPEVNGGCHACPGNRRPADGAAVGAAAGEAHRLGQIRRPARTIAGVE